MADAVPSRARRLAPTPTPSALTRRARQRERGADQEGPAGRGCPRGSLGASGLGPGAFVRQPLEQSDRQAFQTLGVAGERESQHALIGGDGTGAGPGSLTQLPEQVLDMCRHRPDARRDAVGDLAVAQTSGEDRQHVELSFRKAERRRFLGEGDDRRLSACGSVRSLDGDAVPASIKIEPEERHPGAIAHKEGSCVSDELGIGLDESSACGTVQFVNPAVHVDQCGPGEPLIPDSDPSPR